MYVFRCPGKSLLCKEEIQPLCKITSAHSVSWHRQEPPPKSRHEHSTLAQGHWIKLTDQLPFCNPGRRHQTHPARLVSWLLRSSTSESGFPTCFPSKLERWVVTSSELHWDMMKSPARLPSTSGKLNRTPQQAPKKLGKDKKLIPLLFWMQKKVISFSFSLRFWRHHLEAYFQLAANHFFFSPIGYVSKGKTSH